MKDDGEHGDRFFIEIGNVSWKTTSSRKLSTRYKLEEAKKFLRDLKQTRPELFDEYSMNGEHNKKGKELLKEYFDIVHKAGYNYIDRITTEKLTDKYLKQGKINKKERHILESQANLSQRGGIRKRII